MKKIIPYFVFAQLLFAQNSTLSGFVRDKTNKDPLLGANVVLLGTTLGAATDIDGQFAINNIPSGDYKVKVTYIGFKSYEAQITFSQNETIQQNFDLDPEFIQMETYVVTASRRRERVEDAPAAISVITKREIRRESNTNLGDYLKGTKGIDFTQSGIDSYNMTARGFNSSFSSRLLTLMDGRMANVPSLRLTAYNVIPVSFEDVEQIEVVLGPSSALYGPNAHSGVLNIVTSSPLRSQGTSINIQGGLLSQTDTDLLKKITFRTAHKIGNFGFKISGVAMSGQDWTHYNDDEHEGHDPAFIGRANQIHDNLDRGGSLADASNPIFTSDMISQVEGADESWVGYYWGDHIEAYGEDGSPLITRDMIDAASSDEFNRYTLDNGNILWFVTEDKLGYVYADGIDNNGDGNIDEGIDRGVDDNSEAWVDGIDNDGDGFIDESDELGSAWLSRFESYASGVSNTTIYSTPDSSWSILDLAHKLGFGDYQYNDDGQIVFDTNNNGIFNDDWGNNGLDDDGDWGLYKDDLGNAFDTPTELFTDLNDNNQYDSDVGEIWSDFLKTFLDFGLDGLPNTGDFGEGNGVWDRETFEDLNNNNEWDTFVNNDLDGNGFPSVGEVGVDEDDEKDFVMNYGDLSRVYKDANDDGVDDYPVFKVRNYRYDLRLDWEPSNDLTVSLSHGFAWARNINITGIARYLADGWVYRYYQSKMRYKNFFLQAYLNSSYSGNPEHPTRNLATGSLIYDRSKKFSAQLQHVNEWKNGDRRFVWGIDYFLTLPDTKGTILSDKEISDNRDNNGNGEAGSPYRFFDVNDDTWYDKGESYTAWDEKDSVGVASDGSTIYNDNALGAIADGFDNDGDSDDFDDLNGNGFPDYVDADESGLYELGETVEPGVQWMGEQKFLVYADGKDNDGDGKIDENIDEGIDEAAEDNRYTVNELGAYYQVNWKFNKKWEFIQATRFDIHDRLTNFIEFNNQGYGKGYSPFNWKFNSEQKEGLQLSPKFGIVYRPKDNQNFRLTWATAFNTPTNQALFLDIFVTRVSVFKVYARGSDGGYTFPRDEFGRPYFYRPYDGSYSPVDTSESIYFYPSTDPRIEGYFGQTANDIPELEAEIVKSWELGYKGRLSSRVFGTLDLYTSHYSSFVSPVTFITPLVIKKSVLETDYNGDSLMNTIGDIANNNIIDEEDYNTALDKWRDGENLQGVTAMDTIPGFTPPVVVGYVNYGEVDMWGFDASLTAILNLEWTLDLTYSYLGMTEFLNPITNAQDPINAPRHKGGMKLKYHPRRWPFTASLNGRYVDGYKWSSGIYFGDIKPYTLFDFHLGYSFNEHLSGNLTINNIANNRHIEIIGGPSLGRVIVLRLQTKL